jgi:hypothetical protein
MGLQIDSVNIETVQNEPYTSIWIDIAWVGVAEKPATRAALRLVAYRSEADQDVGAQPLRIKDSDIPQELFSRRLQIPLTASQYNTLAIASVAHTQIKQMLEDGVSDNQYNALFPESNWPGLGANKVTINLP